MAVFWVAPVLGACQTNWQVLQGWEFADGGSRNDEYVSCNDTDGGALFSGMTSTSSGLYE